MYFTTFRSVILLLISTSTNVSAHGHVLSYLVGSSTYTAFLPVKTPVYYAPPPSIARNTGGEGPVENFLSRDMVCNFNATPIADNGISRTAPIAAGQEITIQWNGFTHGGPIMTYLARCDPDCGSFNGWDTKSWFKIDEAGYDLVNLKGWATQYHFDNGNKWISKIPSCLAPGEYLLRHEIIAIGACKNAGSCQLYPSCAQLKVTGSGTVRPEDGSEELVTFPGAYTKGDPGILWNSTQDKSLYVPPGPRVWKCPSLSSSLSPSATSSTSSPLASTLKTSSLLSTTTKTSSIISTTTKTSSIISTTPQIISLSTISRTSSSTTTLKATVSLSTSSKTSSQPTTTLTTTSSSVGGTVPRWGQCGGAGWTGGTTCESPWVCTPSGEWYSQCL